ncbi:MAG TPA: glycine betaine/L-proline ABC transporter ATP-binding protein [Bacteroidales bacterium]|nr:glycine betaine/L-proline ABC transporter ATP-binding protein [Bacteroidales bacterium]
MHKIEADNVTLIFGHSKKQALKMLKAGRSKDEIHQKTKSTVAVHNANLRIQEGEIFVIMGLSGSGKSSLLRCFNLLNHPTEGSIRIDGKNILNMDKKQLLQLRRNKIGMVFQHFGLLPHRSILENVAFPLEIQGMPLQERLTKAMDTIEMVGLKGYEHSRPDQLSGGMQQRVGIARALASESDILLMDEAFSALDPLIKSQMQDDLLDIQQKLKKTILFITHDLDEALKIGNTIAIMKDGVIVQQGSPEEILLHPADDYVKAFTGNVDISKIVSAGSAADAFKAFIHIPKEGPAAAARLFDKHKASFLPVLNDQKHFEGIILKKDLKRLIENKGNDLMSIVTEVPRVGEDMSISDLLPLFINQKRPIAVVDTHDKVIGYIRYEDVVSMMTGYDDEEVQKIIEHAN